MSIEHQSEPPKGSTYKFTIINKLTGKIELELDDVEGGIYVVHQATDTELGTRQGAIGKARAILLSSFKAPTVLRDLLRKMDMLERTRELAKMAGLDLSI